MIVEVRARTVGGAQWCCEECRAVNPIRGLPAPNDHRPGCDTGSVVLSAGARWEVLIWTTTHRPAVVHCPSEPDC